MRGQRTWWVERTAESASDDRRRAGRGYRAVLALDRAMRGDAEPEQTPLRPAHQMRKPRPNRLSSLSGAFSIVLVVSIAALMANTIGIGELTAPGPLVSNNVVSIVRGSAADSVEKLDPEGVIENSV